MDTWQPISAEELDALVATQLSECSVEQQQLFEQCRVVPYLAKIERSGAIETVFVVARRDNIALYYEDVEEGFNISELRPDGSISNPGFEQWELCHALRYLPTHSAGKHHQVRYADLIQCREAPEEASEQAMAELTRQSQELGLGYD